jgi:hypothetical protein
MADPDDWHILARAAVREWVQGGKEAKTIEGPSHTSVNGTAVTHRKIAHRGFTLHVIESRSGGRTVAVERPDGNLQVMHDDGD